MNTGKVELILNKDPDLNKIKCRHGPTLLLRSENEEFLACSACRDRRDCDMFIPLEKRTHKSTKSMRQQHQREYKNFRKFLRTLDKNRKENLRKQNTRYCYKCSLIFPDEEKSEHDGHKSSDYLTRKHRTRPCEQILSALENKRSDAQFFFSPSFIEYLTEKLIDKGPWDGILCIGCPTIFENIRSKKKCFLLDFDHRFRSFYSSKKMIVFNMFNGHAFSSRRFFEQEFLPNLKHLLVVVDPPFGGFHRALSNSIGKLFQSTNIETNFILFNPYFLEKWVVESFPKLRMLDYKVEYASNSSMNLCRGKKGSPVRMFVDFDDSKYPPLDEMNYKFCFPCNRYTLLTNQHCLQCESCTSKDGLPYRHCSLCQRCVKAERKHCSNCNVCHLPNQCLDSKGKRENDEETFESRKKQKI